MANLIRKGFHPVKMANGEAYVGRGRPYYVPSTYGTAIYIGDAVIKTGTSNTSEVSVVGCVGGAASFAPGTLAEVNVATVGDGNRITGFVTSVGYDINSVNRPGYRPASTQAVIWVEDNPDVLFEGSCSGTLAATDIGLNAVLISTGGSTVTGLSAVQIDTTSDVPAADASNQLLLVAVSRDPMKNDLSSTGPSAYVRINQSTETFVEVLGI